MILEEETYEKFGYYPGDLKPKSGKKILIACDGCGKIREIYKGHYRDFCPSCAQKGERSHNYGKHYSENTKKKMSEAHKGEKHPLFGKHHSVGTLKKMSDIKKGKKASQTTKAKMREARKHRKFPKHHTKPELIFEQICKKNNLPFKYTGDGSFWIGKKSEKQLNPDFIEVNGKKICVEIMGAYWHSRLLNQNLREDALLLFREKHYKKYKWIPVFIWDTDLLRKDSEQFVLNSLKKNGI